LIKIGEPCFHEVVGKLESGDNYRESRLCLVVLTELRDRATVIKILKDAITRQNEPIKKYVLQKRLDWFLELPEDDI
jgi:hypothetical protein